jgi:hypothetical protein
MNKLKFKKMGVDFSAMLEASFFSTFRILFICMGGFLLVKFKVKQKNNFYHRFINP